jgi:hypothetical protein
MSSASTSDPASIRDTLVSMEVLWDRLRQHEDQVPVPQWHKDLLDERLKLIEEVKARFIDWETAKQRIAARTA